MFKRGLIQVSSFSTQCSIEASKFSTFIAYMYFRCILPNPRKPLVPSKGFTQGRGGGLISFLAPREGGGGLLGQGANRGGIISCFLLPTKTEQKKISLQSNRRLTYSIPMF